MPRLLLDTNVLLWVIDAPHRLPAEVAKGIADSANEVLFSAASVWEIAIKASRHKSDFEVDALAIASDAVSAGFVERPITSAVAARVADLPTVHRDPFDRLLIAQAMSEPATLLTSDKILERYSKLVTVFVPR